MMNFWKRLFASLRPDPMTTAVAEAPTRPKPRDPGTVNADLPGTTNYDFTKPPSASVSFTEPAMIRTPEKSAADKHEGLRAIEMLPSNTPNEPSAPNDASRVSNELAQYANSDLMTTSVSAALAIGRPEPDTTMSFFKRFAAERDVHEKAQRANEKDDADDQKDDSSYGTFGLEMSMVPGLGNLGRRFLRDCLLNEKITSKQAALLEVKIKEMEDEGLEPAAIEDRTRENVKGIRREPSKAEILAAYKRATEDQAKEVAKRRADKEAEKGKEEGKNIKKDDGPSMGM